MKILWLSPNFNHYKARFLNNFAKEDGIDLTILSGSGRIGKGDLEIEENWNFKLIKSNVPKSKFGISIKIIRIIFKDFSNYDWILIPAEKKNIFLFMLLRLLRLISKKTKLVSYNHPLLQSRHGKITKMDVLITKFYYRKLDRVIFYTKSACEFAIKNKLVQREKAFWANNTLDNTEIEKHYTYKVLNNRKFTFLFIGRMIENKKLEVLFDYFEYLKKTIKDKELSLELIGDGPMSSLVKSACLKDKSIHWHGLLINEMEIAPVMKRANVIFIPGHSGLSINHAMMYGRPYITIKAKTHAPEISYLKSGINGFELSGDKEKDLHDLTKIILDDTMLQKCSENAMLTGKELSVDKWVEQMKFNFNSTT